MPANRIPSAEIVVHEQPTETTGDPPEDMEIRWGRPKFWIRALATTVLFIVAVAGIPVLIGMLIGHWLDLDVRTHEIMTLVVCAALMPGFVITLRQRYLQVHRPFPYAFLMRLRKGDRFAVIAWVIPVGVAVAMVGEIIEQALMLDFNPTVASVVMTVLLYTICLNLYGHHLASPRSAGQ